MAGGRFAVGAGDADRAQSKIGLAPETPGKRRQRAPAIRHEREPYVRRHLDGTLGDHGHGAGGEGRRNVGMAVVAQSSPRDKAGSRANLPRVELHRGDRLAGRLL